MTSISATKAQRERYTRDAVMSASPVRLLTMLYDRLLLDLDRAEAAHGDRAWSVASANLLHAQDIVAELMSSLRLDAWDGAERLLALYGYVSAALVTANVDRDTARIRESIALLEPLRQAWHEAAGLPGSTGLPAAPARVEGGLIGVA